MKRCENTFNGFYFAQNNAFGLIWLHKLLAGNSEVLAAYR